MNTTLEEIEEREFPTTDVITALTGYLVSRNGIGALYDVLNFMTNDNLFTHQLARAFDETKPYLVEQHPDLALLHIPNWDGLAPEQREPAVRAWIEEQLEKFGPTRVVRRIPAEAHKRIDPITEANTLMGKNRSVIPVVVGDPA